MHPVLIEPFGFKIYSYSAALLVAFILGTALSIWIAKRRGPTDPSFIQDVTMMGIIWGLVGGRVGWVLWEFEYYFTNPVQIFNLRAGGMTILGGIVLPLLVLYIYFRSKGTKAPLNVLDIYAAPLLFGMALGRFGCILHGCCQGDLCDPGFPIALTYPEGTFGPGVAAGPRYPSQLFETVADLILMFGIIKMMPHIKFAGQAIFTMLFGYGVIRFLNEFTRGDIKYIGPITLAQWVAIGMCVVGGLGLIGAFGKGEVDSSWQKGFDKKNDD